MSVDEFVGPGSAAVIREPPLDDGLPLLGHLPELIHLERHHLGAGKRSLALRAAVL